MIKKKQSILTALEVQDVVKVIDFREGVIEKPLEFSLVKFELYYPRRGRMIRILTEDYPKFSLFPNPVDKGFRIYVDSAFDDKVLNQYFDDRKDFLSYFDDIIYLHHPEKVFDKRYEFVRKVETDE